MNTKFYWILLAAIFLGGVLGGQIQKSLSAPAGEKFLSSSSTVTD